MSGRNSIHLEAKFINSRFEFYTLSVSESFTETTAFATGKFMHVTKFPFKNVHQTGGTSAADRKLKLGHLH